MTDIPTPTAFERIQRGRYALAGFVRQVWETAPVIGVGSHAAGDAARSGSDQIPVRVVEGYIASAADHLKAWLRVSECPPGDERPLLHLYADYTLWRAIIEALGTAIWALGPDSQEERIRRATRLALYEWQDSGPVARPGRAPDASTTQLKAELRRVIERVCTSMSWEVAAIEHERLSPRKVMDGARNHLGSPGRDLTYWWTMCSRYAHAQTLTVMLRGRRMSLETPFGGVVDVETNEELVAELVEFGVVLLNALIRLTNQRGYLRTHRATP